MNHSSGSEEELIRRLGKPQDEVELLTDSRPYTIWLGVFLLLSLCALSAVLVMMGTLILMRTLSSIGDGWYRPFLLQYILIFIAGPLGPGVALC